MICGQRKVLTGLQPCQESRYIRIWKNVGAAISRRVHTCATSPTKGQSCFPLSVSWSGLWTSFSLLHFVELSHSTYVLTSASKWGTDLSVLNYDSWHGEPLSRVSPFPLILSSREDSNFLTQWANAARKHQVINYIFVMHAIFKYLIIIWICKISQFIIYIIFRCYSFLLLWYYNIN